MEPDYEGNTPLHHAVIYGNDSAAKMLLSLGANTNDTNRRGETPQDIARKYNRSSLLKQLQPVAHGVLVPNRELH
jgi:ankyrin repeat protein